MDHFKDEKPNSTFKEKKEIMPILSLTIKDGKRAKFIAAHFLTSVVHMSSYTTHSYILTTATFLYPFANTV